MLVNGINNDYLHDIIENIPREISMESGDITKFRNWLLWKISNMGNPVFTSEPSLNVEKPDGMDDIDITDEDMVKCIVLIKDRKNMHISMYTQLPEIGYPFEYDKDAKLLPCAYYIQELVPKFSDINRVVRPYVQNNHEKVTDLKFELGVSLIKSKYGKLADLDMYGRPIKYDFYLYEFEIGKGINTLKITKVSNP